MYINITITANGVESLDQDSWEVVLSVDIELYKFNQSKAIQFTNSFQSQNNLHFHLGSQLLMLLHRISRQLTDCFLSGQVWCVIQVYSSRGLHGMPCYVSIVEAVLVQPQLHCRSGECWWNRNWGHWQWWLVWIGGAASGHSLLCPHSIHLIGSKLLSSFKCFLGFP